MVGWGSCSGKDAARDGHSSQAFARTGKAGEV